MNRRSFFTFIGLAPFAAKAAAEVAPDDVGVAPSAVNDAMRSIVRFTANGELVGNITVNGGTAWYGSVGAHGDGGTVI